MVEFDFPGLMMPDHLAQLDKQREQLQALLEQGQLRAYGLSQDGGRFWLMCTAGSDLKVLELISRLPMSKTWIPSIIPLHTCEVAEAVTA